MWEAVLCWVFGLAGSLSFFRLGGRFGWFGCAGFGSCVGASRGFGFGRCGGFGGCACLWGCGSLGGGCGFGSLCGFGAFALFFHLVYAGLQYVDEAAHYACEYTHHAADW